MILVAASVWPASAHAFDDEGHFHMTYLAARLAGLSPEDALEVASATVGVDASSGSSPMPNWYEIAAHPIDEVKRLDTVLPGLHSFKPPGGDESTILANMDRLYEQAKSNPDNLDRLGVYLHFVGDYQAHQHEGQGHIAAFPGQFGCAFDTHGHAAATDQIRVDTLATAALTADPKAVGDLARQMGAAMNQIEKEAHWVDELDSRPAVTQRLLQQTYFQIKRYAEQTGRTLSPPVDEKAAMELFRDLSTHTPPNFDAKKEDFSTFLNGYLDEHGHGDIEVPRRGDAIAVMVGPNGETFRTSKTAQELLGPDVLPTPSGEREQHAAETEIFDHAIASNTDVAAPLSPEERAQLDALSALGNEKGVRIRFDIAAVERAIGQTAIDASTTGSPDAAADPIVARVAGASELVVELEPTVVAVSLRRLLVHRDDVAALDRLAHVTGYVIDIAHDDVILLGTPGAADEPAFDVDDLIVALRDVWGHGRTPLCSLDPKDPQHLEAGFQTRVEGVPVTSHFGKVMLEADYAMKRIHMRLDPDIPDGMKTAFDYSREEATIQSAEGDDQIHRLSRFWLTPMPLGKGDVRVSAGGRLVLFAAHVQNRTEVMLAADDGLVGTGKLDPADEKGALELTQRYGELAARHVWLRRLQIEFELTLMADLLRVHLPRSTLLDEVAALPIQEEPIDPTRYAVLTKRVPELVVIGGVEVVNGDATPAVVPLDQRPVSAQIAELLAVQPAAEHSPRERWFLEAIDRFWEGQAAVQAGNDAGAAPALTAAEELLGKTLAEDESFAPALLLRAYIRIGQGTNVDGGVEDARRVLALRPRTGRAYTLLGMAKLGSDLPEALRMMGMAIDATPHDTLAHTMRGAVQMLSVATAKPMFVFDFDSRSIHQTPLAEDEQAKLRAAEDDFAATLDKDPSDETARMSRAMTRLFLGDLDGARTDAAASPHALHVQAFVELMRGDLDDADQHASRVIDDATAQSEATVQALVVRAGVRFTRGDLAGAHEDLSRALSVAPQLAATMQQIDDELVRRL